MRGGFPLGLGCGRDYIALWPLGWAGRSITLLTFQVVQGGTRPFLTAKDRKVYLREASADKKVAEDAKQR